MRSAPKISAVIPTIGRTSLLSAVESVLDQTSCTTEAIVVLDAPERSRQVEELLSEVPHSLLLTDHLGAPAARNLGLDTAQGDYIGYLDDDDVWLPTKSIAQVAAICSSARPEESFSVSLSEFVRADGTKVGMRPNPFKTEGQTLANYLVERRHLRYRGTYFNTPTLIGPKKLMQSVRWDTALRKHQDWDLLVRLVMEHGASPIVVDEALARVFQGSPGSISASSNWQHGADWLERHDLKLSGRARADFILLHILLHAVRSRSVEGIKMASSSLSVAPPHLAACVRFLAGALMNR